MEEKPKKRALSPKLQLRRMGVMLPVDLFEWFKKKAEKERKSLSLLLTEILTKVREEEEKEAN